MWRSNMHEAFLTFHPQLFSAHVHAAVGEALQLIRAASGLLPGRQGPEPALAHLLQLCGQQVCIYTCHAVFDWLEQLW